VPPAPAGPGFLSRCNLFAFVRQRHRHANRAPEARRAAVLRRPDHPSSTPPACSTTSKRPSGRRRQAARQHGRRRIQAPGAGPHLPQIRLRHLRRPPGRADPPLH
jgi:hypothetical protein